MYSVDDVTFQLPIGHIWLSSTLSSSPSVTHWERCCAGPTSGSQRPSGTNQKNKHGVRKQQHRLSPAHYLRASRARGPRRLSIPQLWRQHDDDSTDTSVVDFTVASAELVSVWCMAFPWVTQRCGWNSHGIKCFSGIFYSFTAAGCCTFDAFRDVFAGNDIILH